MVWVSFNLTLKKLFGVYKLILVNIKLVFRDLGLVQNELFVSKNQLMEKYEIKKGQV